MSDGSENKKILSELAGPGQESASVYDFLYYDVRRVGSFYAQLTELGDWQQLTQSNTVAKGLKRGWKLGVGGGMGDVATGEVSLERGPGESGTITSERIYDPLWMKARLLLDYLESRDLIQRQIGEARIGQFVLIQGTLVVLDVAMLKSAWDKPGIKKRIMAEADRRAAAAAAESGAAALPLGNPNRHQRRRQDALGQAPDKGNEDTQMLIELLTILPHSIQAQLVAAGGARVWCSLSPESLVGLSSDLVLKHGSHVPGEWSMLGVLDAYPVLGLESADIGKLSELEELVAGLAGTLVGKLTAQLSPLTRRILGRPHRAHGMTPLLIFREVGG